MSLSDRARTALDELFKKEICIRHPIGSSFDVKEDSKDGSATVHFALPGDALCVEFILKDVPFGFLSTELFGNNKTADAAFLIHGPRGGWEAHVIECKKTISATEWEKAWTQLYSSLMRLEALAGVMGVRVERVVCYTAFRRDLLSANPSFFKAPVGEDDLMVRQHRTWIPDRLSFTGVYDAVPHHKVQLDEATGEAVCSVVLA